MKGFGIHTSLWSHSWTREAAELSIAEAARYGLAFVEIALLEPAKADTGHTRALLEKHGVDAVCSLGLPNDSRPTNNPDKALEFLTLALDKTAEIGAKALSGVVYGSIGERTGNPPTEAEYDAVVKVMDKAAAHARTLGLELGLEAVNRYENHMMNTTEQVVRVIERIGAPNVFLHLDTYHMNIEEKGQANGILKAGEHLKYIHLSESDRGVPGSGTIAWDEVFAGLAGIGFKGGMAMESFIHMPPQLASALSVWRPVANSREEILAEGLPFLRNKAKQYGLI
ncbi:MULTISPECIES: sugar phosphate isomerase/epimerase family protein [Labrys]|jgi:D-psicose/D-tagatose/L-ribulose 3-epimerase|uniref:sugar phosphate isomerase/epimerase family protein n=1 Tax=Labrys TaxID=204476 RepID=UPI000832F216|nr:MULTISPECIES: sugar phosphate isomerase/epimerase family protein [unclassified Labrys (in: a-proteobacteria)]MDZ5451803.1 sugar phosphate isomerase/epimerase family protein [Labrys sp. ZIDIC5]OCC06522.1 D-tagatose 3-epimerase [Labrys sp. WJW]